MNRADLVRSLYTNRLGFKAMLWSKLPLAAFAGLRVARLDDTSCEVRLPAGWRTQNPFQSTYFAAQAMAGEMSTGAPMLWLIEQSGAKVSSLVTSLSAKFTKKAVKETAFVFSDVAGMREAIDRAVATGEPVVFTAKSVGTQVDGTPVAEFTIEWSFKKKS